MIWQYERARRSNSKEKDKLDNEGPKEVTRRSLEASAKVT
jgi:hypothetical protein